MIRKKILKYTIPICFALSFVLISQKPILAAVTDQTNTTNKNDVGMNQAESKYDANVTSAKNNILASVGLTNRNQADKYYDVTTTDGKAITSEYLKQNQGKPVADYAKISYKSDATSQQLQKIFGENTTQANDFLNRNSSASQQEFNAKLNRLSEIQTEYGKFAEKIKQNANSSSSSNATSFAGITNGTDLEIISYVLNSINKSTGDNTSGVPCNLTPEEIQRITELASEWEKETGNRNILEMTPEEIELLIQKAGDNGKDASVELTPATRTFRSITRVRYTITERDSGNPVSLATPDNAKTQELFNRYDASYVSKWKNATGTSIPSIKSIGTGVYEIDFETPINATENKWKKILNEWTTVDNYASDFAGVGAFTITPSSTPLHVQVDVLGRTYSDTEVISSAIYPAGKVGSDNNGTYVFSKFKDSYEENWYISGVDKEEGYLKETYGKVPNRVAVVRKRVEEDDDDEETSYSISYKDNMPFHKEYDFDGTEDDVKRPYGYNYWKEKVSSIKTDYYYAKGVGDGDQIMSSTYDGKYCRDIKFRTTNVRHWNYRDDLVLGSEAYPSDNGINSAVMLRYKDGNKTEDLVTYSGSDVDSQVMKGYCDVKEADTWRQPSVVNDETVFSTAGWDLVPLSGKIWIPVQGPSGNSGNMHGVINGANNLIGDNRSSDEINNK